jgi:hypothetical protein
MNAVEIEQAITDLAEQALDPAEFPYSFLAAFGNEETTIKRLRADVSNKSDLGGVLQTGNIHILTCVLGQVPQTFAALKASPATAKAKAKFILATDGDDFEAKDLTIGETVSRIKDGSIFHYSYDPKIAKLIKIAPSTQNPSTLLG